MCLPVVAAAALIAGATVGLQTVMENQAAHATNRALQAQNTQRKTEIDQAATQEINDRLRAMRREQSRIQVAAGESGLSLGSGSVEAQLQDSLMQAKIANDVSLANRESRKLASDAETRSKLQSSTTALGAGLKIGLASAGAAIGKVTSTSAATSAGR